MKAIIDVNKFGIIEVELDRNNAPISVDNFVKLASKVSITASHSIELSLDL